MKAQRSTFGISTSGYEDLVGMMAVKFRDDLFDTGDIVLLNDSSRELWERPCRSSGRGPGGEHAYCGYPIITQIHSQVRRNGFQ